MKTMLLLLLVLTVSRAMAQHVPKALASATNASKEKSPRKVIFSYRNGFGTSHDTVMYLRDTLMGKRLFSLVQLGDGEIRRVPVRSLNFIDAPVSSLFNATLAKAQ